MKNDKGNEVAEVLREYGPFDGVENVGGVTWDGKQVWFAGGNKLGALDPETGKELRALNVAAHAGTAFDGKHLYQIAEDKIHKIDHATGKSSLFRDDCPGVNGTMFGADGRLYACLNGRKQIVSYGMNGDEKIVAEGYNSNDLCITAKGDIYFTEPPTKKVWHIPPGGTPKAVITEGIELNSLIGRRFTLDGVEFEGMEESRPCHWMNGAVAPGAEDWLRGRGGLRAKVLSDGRLLVGRIELRLFQEVA